MDPACRQIGSHRPSPVVGHGTRAVGDWLGLTPLPQAAAPRRHGLRRRRTLPTTPRRAVVKAGPPCVMGSNQFSCELSKTYSPIKALGFPAILGLPWLRSSTNIIQLLTTSHFALSLVLIQKSGRKNKRGGTSTTAKPLGLNEDDSSAVRDIPRDSFHRTTED